MRFRQRRLFLAVVASGFLPLSAYAQEVIPQDRPPRPSFWQAAAGVVVVNWVTWGYNWYIQRWPWARVDLQSWGLNLRQGVAWDDDSYRDNQFLHPYHGSLYHNSARASGFGFWGSMPFVAAGSATWEFFGENIIASANDLINTTLGGMALGEVTFRLSRMIGRGGRGGNSSLGRQVGAFALSPMAVAQGLLNPQSGRQSAAGVYAGQPAILALGQRSSHPFLELSLPYGDPFADGALGPYDAFDFQLLVSPGGGELIQRLEISGLLTRAVSGSPGSRVAVGVYQHYDYENLSNFKFGGHSLSAALMYQRALGGSSRLNLSTHAEGILLGGISSDQAFYWRRDYDLGPGVGTRIGAAWVRDGREWLRFDGRLWWLHSVHGSEGNHLASSLRVAASLPLVSGVGAGGDMTVTTRRSVYPDGPAVTRRVQQLRAYLTWAP
jgi:Domain of unknown function (DUF3943)